MNADDRVFRPHPRAAFRTIGADVVIVHTLSNRLVKLNETGSAIWQRLDGRSVDQIAGEIVGLFEVTEEQALSETGAFLEHLLERGFVEIEAAGDHGGD
jgi:hypothetical protein